MPIEIRELVIRATVDPTGDGESGCGKPSSKSAPAKSNAPSQAEPDVVQTCVREVLRILEQKRER
jgi:hypothetical protein